MTKSNTNRAAICFLVSSRMTFETLKPHVRALSQSKRVIVIANFRGDVPFITDAGQLTVIHLPIVRGVAVISDLVSLVGLTSLFSKIQPEVLITMTPKAGLLGQIAGYWLKIPIRIHWFTGQVWSNKGGLVRLGLKLADRLVASISTFGLVDGQAQLSFLQKHRVISRRKFSVLGHGSVSGVDVDRFRPDVATRAEVRSQLQIGPDEVLVSFVGRLARDKGITDLAHAMVAVRSSLPMRLMAVGPDEEGLQIELEQILDRGAVPFVFLGHVSDPERYLQASDIFCLPSYREGFPTAVLEASAVGLPVLVSRIYGTEDTFVEGYTGVSFAPGDREKLERALVKLAGSREEASKMGLAGIEYVSSRFKQSHLVEAFVHEIETALSRL